MTVMFHPNTLHHYPPCQVSEWLGGVKPPVSPTWNDGAGPTEGVAETIGKVQVIKPDT